MSEPVGGEGRDPGGAVTSGLADCEDLVAQRGRVSRLREAGAADYEIRPAVKALESLLRSVILEQGARLRRLRSDTAGQAQCEEAVARLQALKAEFQEVSGKAWSDVREEGPIFLTTNAVRGSEIMPELKGTLKQLNVDNILRSELTRQTSKHNNFCPPNFAVLMPGC